MEQKPNLTSLYRTGFQCEDQSFNYWWTITNFRHREKTEKIILSPFFPEELNGKLIWRMKLKNGMYHKQNYISLFLTLVHSKISSISAQYTFCIKDCAKAYRFLRSGENNFAVKMECGFEDYVEKTSLMNDASLIPDDTLTLFCYITLDTINIKSIPEYELVNNIASLLGDTTFSDVVFSVRGKEFPAHKSILASRSPVFKAMFSQEMEEKKQNRVAITDIEPEVFGELLQYIYTGKAYMLLELAYKLLPPADKYDLGILAFMCEEALCTYLSVENAANILLLADRHNAHKLKVKALGFITQNPINVGKTLEFRMMGRSRPELVVECFEALAEYTAK